MHKNQKIGWLFAGAALGMWAGFGFSVGYTRTWLGTSTATQGEVISVAAIRSCKGKSRTYCPTVTFRTASGWPIIFESDVSSNPPTHEVGDRVAVRYQATQPTDARIDEFFEIWLLPVVLGFLGVGFMIPGFILTLTRAGRPSTLRDQFSSEIEINA